MLEKHIFEDFTLLIGEDARDLFRYFNTSELHGLTFDDCSRRMKEGGTFIDGFCNWSPVNDKPFLFLNQKTMNEQEIWKTSLLVMHETMHLVFLLNEKELESSKFTEFWKMEEKLISDAEKYAESIMTKLKFPKIFFMYEKNRTK
jgi:hypothetical protein